jgi:hypothetical protein
MFQPLLEWLHSGKIHVLNTMEADIFSTTAKAPRDHLSVRQFKVFVLDALCPGWRLNDESD